MFHSSDKLLQCAFFIKDKTKSRASWVCASTAEREREASPVRSSSRLQPELESLEAVECMRGCEHERETGT